MGRPNANTFTRKNILIPRKISFHRNKGARNVQESLTGPLKIAELQEIVQSNIRVTRGPGTSGLSWDSMRGWVYEIKQDS